MSPKFRAAFLCVLAALLLTTTGCISGAQRFGFPMEHRVPYAGGKIDPAVFDALDPEAYEKNVIPGKQRSVFWAIPFNMYEASAEAPTTNTMVTNRMVWNDVLFPIVSLPWRMNYSEHRYARGSAEPVAFRRLNWNLLWASAKHQGLRPGEFYFEAAGVPLFFSTLAVKGQQGFDFRYWNALWTLGPSFATIHADPKHIKGVSADAGDDGRLSLTMGAPLLLGGPLGVILWFDTSVHAESPMGTTSVNMHGPIAGSAGWMGFRETRTDGTRSRTNLLLYGILWSDNMAQEGNDRRTLKSATGPLWGMLGWGHKRGKAAVRFLWIPIVLPFQGDVPAPEGATE